MSRRHALAVAAMFALAAVIGFTALSRTVQLGSASRHAERRARRREDAAAERTSSVPSIANSRPRRSLTLRPPPSRQRPGSTPAGSSMYGRPRSSSTSTARAAKARSRHEGGGFDD